jgi:hypothetical protein
MFRYTTAIRRSKLEWLDIKYTLAGSMSPTIEATLNE